MLTQEEKKNVVFEAIGFVATSQARITEILRDKVDSNDIYLITAELVRDGLINMTMGNKGPEFSRKWNTIIDEERKSISRELNTRFDKNTIFYPRYEGYVANIQDNFLDGDAEVFKREYSELSSEYFMWHRNAKTNNVYPPKMHALNSASVLACNVVKALNLEPEQVIYAAEFEVIASEPLRDRPEEVSAPKAFFDSIIGYDDEVHFVQGNFLEPFYAPYRTNLWPYQYGNRYLFDDADAVAKWRQFAGKLNAVYFDGFKAFKSVLSVYNDVLANPEDYQNKKVKVLNICWNLSDDSKFENLKAFSKNYFEEAAKFGDAFNEFLASLPLPEGTTLVYETLKLDDVCESLAEEHKEYIKNRYSGF